ncbi:MAG: transcription antitermination factor NusB [Clostridium sp.]
MNRKRSREVAMELLFAKTLSKNTMGEVIEALNEEYVLNEKGIDSEYIINLLKTVEDNISEIDSRVQESLVGWTIDRVSKINLTILRVSVCEILYMEDVPNKVAINEAIELTRTYSDEKSISFVNGVLDKIFKSL